MSVAGFLKAGFLKIYMKKGFEDSRIRGFKGFNINAFHLNPLYMKTDPVT